MKQAIFQIKEEFYQLYLDFVLIFEMNLLFFFCCYEELE